MSKRAHRVRCKICNGHRDDVGIISHTGKCHACGIARAEENIYGLHFHRGPALDRWRRGMAACIGITLDDKQPDNV